MVPTTILAMRHRLTPSLLQFVALSLLVLALVSPPARLLANAPPDPESECPLCATDLPVPVVPLSAAWLDSLAQAHASFNDHQIARIDSLLANGHFGSPKKYTSQKQANLLARLTTVNAYHDLIRLATDSTKVYEANEATLTDLYTHYSDVILFSAIRLQSIRFGLGRVCMRYTIGEDAEGEEIYGGRTLRWRVKETTVQGQKRRLLHLDLPSSTDDIVKVMLAPHHSFEVQYSRIDGPPAPYEWFLVYNIQGVWLRKHGIHRPTAYMFWVNLMDTDAEFPADLPATPLVGVRVYIPGLRLRLPLLPDVGFDDLREIELPMPILSMQYLKDSSQPSWLGKTKTGFMNWRGVGPVPTEIRQRFPDL